MESLDDEELGRRVRSTLQELYPFDGVPNLAIRRPPRRRGHTKTILLVGAAAASAAVVATFAIGHRSSDVTVADRPSGRSAGVLDQRHDSTWEKTCFQRWAAPRQQDGAYVGLTLAQALNLARDRQEQLVLVGVNGQCVDMNDDVARPQPVAVVFDRGSVAETIPREAVVLLANSNPRAEYSGWGLQ